MTTAVGQELSTYSLHEKRGRQYKIISEKSKSIMKVKRKDVVGVFMNAESNPASVLSYFYDISGGIGHLSV